MLTADGRAFKAKKGVILACGGWENDPDLMNTYYTCGYPGHGPAGTPYNMGDGLKMAQSVGADLWHMNNFSLANLGAKVSSSSPCVSFPNWSTKDYIYVGPNAKRYCYEETASLNKHGKRMFDGVYVSAARPDAPLCRPGQHRVRDRAAVPALSVPVDRPHWAPRTPRTTRATWTPA